MSSKFNKRLLQMAQTEQLSEVETNKLLQHLQDTMPQSTKRQEAAFKATARRREAEVSPLKEQLYAEGSEESLQKAIDIETVQSLGQHLGFSVDLDKAKLAIKEIEALPYEATKLNADTLLELYKRVIIGSDPVRQRIIASEGGMLDFTDRFAPEEMEALTRLQLLSSAPIEKLMKTGFRKHKNVPISIENAAGERRLRREGYVSDLVSNRDSMYDTPLPPAQMIEGQEYRHPLEGGHIYSQGQLGADPSFVYPEVMYDVINSRMEARGPNRAEGAIIEADLAQKAEKEKNVRLPTLAEQETVLFNVLGEAIREGRNEDVETFFKEMIEQRDWANQFPAMNDSRLGIV